jgi:hypothetical protein
MPFLVFLSVCSYWRTVNVEMTKSTSSFLTLWNGRKPGQVRWGFGLSNQFC